MSGKDRKPQDEQPRPGEPFLARFHRRKLEARDAGAPAAAQDPPLPDGTPSRAPATTGGDLAAPRAAEQDAPSDADMPALDTLTTDSDYRGFLSPRVSEGLRRAALRRLFHGAEFDVVDGLDDYADDHTDFRALGEVITADMRHLLEVEARERAQAVERTLRDADQLSGASESRAPAGEEAPEGDDGHRPAGSSTSV